MGSRAFFESKIYERDIWREEMSPISNQTSNAPAMLQNDDGRYYSYGILKYFEFYKNLCVYVY